MSFDLIAPVMNSAALGVYASRTILREDLRRSS